MADSDRAMHEASEHRTSIRRERILLILAASFLLAGALTLAISIQLPTFNFQLSSSILIFTLVAWALSFSVTHVLLNRWLPERDPFLLPTAALLTGWGLLLITRLAPNFLLRQITWLLVSTGALIAIVHFSRDLRWLRRFRYTWLFGGLALLALTLVFGVNPSGYGPRLWLGAFGVYVQPAEPLKLLLIVYLASYLAERRDLIVREGHKTGRWRLPPLAYVGPLLAMFGLAMVILAWQQDLGAALLFFFTFLTMLYLATGQWGYIVAGLALFMAAGAVGYAVSDKVALRVDTWLNPWPEAADRAFQIVQSLLAFGAGGILGQGLGLGHPTYIPAVHTDFVFAAIGEEFGLLGTLGIVALYAILTLRGLRVAAHARPSFERFLAAGVAAGIAIQAWVIMAGNAKIIPITGVTLPFVSYGGSSLLTTFIALGLLLRVSGNCEIGELKIGRLKIGKLVHAHPTTTNDQSTNYQSTNYQSTNYQSTNLPIYHLACTLTLALALLAATCGYWGVARAESLRARGDNPRRILYEQRIVRGRILDRSGVVLADVTVAEDGVATRRYPVPQAAPVVGYASLRYGTGGIEAAFDGTLRGEAGRSVWRVAWDELLHRSPRGHNVRLTLDAALQRQAQDALAGQSGAVVLLDATTGEILALASAPTFDPARLDEMWEELRDDPAAPLLNRATHGLYQPGSALQTVILAEALVAGTADLAEPVANATAAVPVNGNWLACSAPITKPATLAQAYAAACPAPFADLGERLNVAGLEEAVHRWAFTTPPVLEIPAESADWSAEQIMTAAALRGEAVGQGQLTVTPLRMALVAATLAGGGTMPAPRLALQIQTERGDWRTLEAPGATQTVLPPGVAQALLRTWPPYAPNVLGHLGSAVAGEEQPLAWFLGVAPAGVPRYAVAVLVERTADPEVAAGIGSALLEAASTH